MQKKTLLQTALEFKTKKSYSKEVTDEMVELAVAWMKGEITQGQAARALGKDSSGGEVTSVLYQLCVAIREGMKDGRITLTYKK